MEKLESCQDQKSVKGGTCIFDMIPDEVLEMIISYVPVKSSCFLVNKRFNKEANNSTRKRCYLLLDRHLIKKFNLILQTGRQFDEIRLDFSGCNLSRKSCSHLMKNILQIIERFGSSIKKFLIKAWVDGKFIKGENLITMLGLMQNLEHLDLHDCNSITTEMTSEFELRNLKSLKSSDSKLLNLFTCPSLEKLVVDWANNDTVSFIQRHIHLKQLSFFDAMSNANLNALQSILSIEGLKLNSLEVKSFSNSQVGHQLTFCSALKKQDELKTLKLLGYFVNDQVLHCILRLTKLESLSINLRYDNVEPISEIHIAEILQLSQLKVLMIGANRLEFFKALSTVENLRLKELSLTLCGYNIREQHPTAQQHSTLQSFAENLPNIKKAVLKGFNSTAVLNMTTHFNNLENLEFEKNWPISSETVNMAPPNLKIRELFLGFHNAKSENVIEAFVKLAPNVTKFVYDPGHFFHGHAPRYAFQGDPRAIGPRRGYAFRAEAAMDSADLNSILKFTRLTEFQAPASLLLMPEAIALMKEKGKQIEKMILRTQEDVTQELVLHYGGEFPFQKFNRTNGELIMMREVM